MLRARVDRGDVLEAEQRSDVIDELQLLCRRIDQREVHVRRNDRKRKSGKSRAGADIGNARAVQVRVSRQAVEEVLRDLLWALAYCREIHALVPYVELIEHTHELANSFIVERHAELCRAGFQYV